MRLDEAMYKFGSTQIDVRGMVNAAAIGASFYIHTDHLGAKGRSTDPHVTVQYGLAEDVDVGTLSDAVRDFGVVSFEFGLTGTFPVPDDKPDAPIVVMVRKAKSLRALREVVRATVTFTDTHPTYVPHMTLGYVKKQFVSRYVGMPWLLGLSVTAYNLSYSSADGNRRVLPMCDSVVDQLQQDIDALLS